MTDPHESATNRSEPTTDPHESTTNRSELASDPHGSAADGGDSVDRRTVLRGLGVGAVAAAGLSGTASAHEAIGEPAFYGTSELSVCVSGNSDVLMARQTGDDYEIGFVVGPDRLDPYPDGTPRYSGNYTISTDDPDVPDGQLIGVQIEGTRWVNPNEVAQAALAAEREQLGSTHDRPEGSSVGPDDGLPCRGDPAAAPDVPLSNYALTLEHLEYALYRDALTEFTDEELMDADALSAFGRQVRSQVPDYLRTVRDHEKAHVDALTATVERLGGDPVTEGSYDFGYTTPTEFFGVASALENTGVAAYAGAAAQIVDGDLLGVAAGIQSVEARHAGFLNLVDGTSPFPDAVDAAASISEVLEIAGAFVTGEIDPSVYEVREYRPPLDRTRSDETSDLDVLEYALTLEHLENTFYREGLEAFDDEELRNADVLSAFGDEVREAVPDALRTVSSHEAAHVTAVTDTVAALGGDPVSEDDYDFGYTTPSEFLAVAQTLENTGVAAYAGVAPTVADDEVFAAAIGIHSVEARHAGFLDVLNGDVPFPDAVDEPKTVAEVQAVVDQFERSQTAVDGDAVPGRDIVEE